VPNTVFSNTPTSWLPVKDAKPDTAGKNNR
jgi:hypothetical protein